MAKISRTKRMAAGRILLTLFGMTNQLAFTMSRVIAKGTHPDALAEGLTEKEWAYLEGLHRELSSTAEAMRRMGQRLLGYRP